MRLKVDASSCVLSEGAMGNGGCAGEGEEVGGVVVVVDGEVVEGQGARERAE